MSFSCNIADSCHVFWALKVANLWKYITCIILYGLILFVLYGLILYLYVLIWLDFGCYVYFDIIFFLHHLISVVFYGLISVVFCGLISALLHGLIQVLFFIFDWRYVPYKLYGMVRFVCLELNFCMICHCLILVVLNIWIGQTVLGLIFTCTWWGIF